MNEDLKTALTALLSSHLTASATLAMLAADIETLRLMFSTVHPEAHELLQKALLRIANDTLRDCA